MSGKDLNNRRLRRIEYFFLNRQTGNVPFSFGVVRGRQGGGGGAKTNRKRFSTQQKISCGATLNIHKKAKPLRVDAESFNDSGNV